MQSVTLTGTSLVRYVYEAIKLQKEGTGDQLSTLGNFSNVYVYFGSVSNPACARLINSSTPTHAPKFQAVVDRDVQRGGLGKEVRFGGGWKALLSPTTTSTTILLSIIIIDYL